MGRNNLVIVIFLDGHVELLIKIYAKFFLAIFFGGSHSTPSSCHFGPSHKYIDKLRAHWSSGKKRNLNT
jgi:prepilin-type processing-associated H-X9-DG protein